MAQISFQGIANDIVEDIIKELFLQGHEYTGDLRRSLRGIEITKRDLVTITAEALQYIEELEEGVPASQIGTQDIKKLAKWVLDKNLAVSLILAEQIAFVIIRKWKKLGKPLETSKEFSKTGEILNAVKIAIAENEERYVAKIDARVLEMFDSKLSNIKSKTI